MRCRKVRKKLPIFLDGEAGNQVRARIASHLEICASCGEEAKTLSSLSVLLKEGKESIKPSPYFWNKIEQRIARAEEKKNLSEQLWGWLNRILIPASATTVLIIGLFIGIQLGEVVYSSIAKILNPESISLVQRDVDQSLYLNALDDFPRESLGEIYTAMLAENDLPK